ncbi:hypothetical protein [Sorangium sp. So ce385]|uniref:hypothetical protein n=1 Tax=Sorangium sp. So ce385 TaxID=3133308 RepID=UPI003F5BE4FC
MRANHAPDDPSRDQLEPVPPLFASFAIEARLNENLHVLQEVYCELTLCGWSSLYPQEQRALRDRISARICRALEHGELVALREIRVPVSAAPLGQGSRAPHAGPATSPPARPPGAGAELSFYELVLLDELETPIADVSMRVSTPAGEVVRRTDASGRVRVDGVPAGWGSAAIASADELARALAGRERGPRRTAPLPEGETWHVRVPSRIGDAVSLPDAESQKLLLVTRTDLVHITQASRGPRCPWSTRQVHGSSPSPRSARCSRSTPPRRALRPSCRG